MFNTAVRVTAGVLTNGLSEIGYAMLKEKPVSRPVFKVAIVGGRDFANFNMLCAAVDHCIKNKIAQGYDIVILNGGARGADALGGRYAELRQFRQELFKPDWDRHGKSAGMRRNTEMSDAADAVVAFWDQSSRGTQHMINYTKSRSKPVAVFTY